MNFNPQQSQPTIYAKSCAIDLVIPDEDAYKATLRLLGDILSVGTFERKTGATRLVFRSAGDTFAADAILQANHFKPGQIVNDDLPVIAAEAE